MDTYYSSRRRRRRHRNSAQSYFFPFLFLIAFIFACFVLYQGIGFILGLQVDDPAISLYIEQGSVELATAEAPTSSLNAISGQKVLAGDIIKTGVGTRAVVNFFDTVHVRLAPQSELILEKAVNGSRDQEIITRLLSGQAWISSVGSDPDKRTDFAFKTPQLVTTALNAQYSLKARMPEYVRVYSGEVVVGVLDPEQNDGESTLEEVPVGIGQQFELTDSALRAFSNRETPSVLSRVDDEFENSSWFVWNQYLDDDPDFITNFDGSSPIANIGLPGDIAIAALGTSDSIDDSDDSDSQDDADDEDTEDQEASEDEDTTTLPVPVLTSPKAGSEINETVLVIEGSVAAGAFGIEVTSFESGVANPYRLQRFEEGDTTWRYIANYDSGNLVEGENRFEIRSLGQDGEKSEALEFTVTLVLPEPEVDPSESGIELSPVEDAQESEVTEVSPPTSTSNEPRQSFSPADNSPEAQANARLLCGEFGGTVEDDVNGRVNCTFFNGECSQAELNGGVCFKGSFDI